MAILDRLVHSDEERKAEYTFYTYASAEGVVDYLLEEDYDITYNSKAMRTIRMVSPDGLEDVTIHWMI